MTKVLFAITANHPGSVNDQGEWRDQLPLSVLKKIIKEATSDNPDHINAKTLKSALKAFEKAKKYREKHFKLTEKFNALSEAVKNRDPEQAHGIVGRILYFLDSSESVAKSITPNPNHYYMAHGATLQIWDSLSKKVDGDSLKRIIESARTGNIVPYIEGVMCTIDTRMMGDDEFRALSKLQKVLAQLVPFGSTKADIELSKRAKNLSRAVHLLVEPRKP